MVCYCNRGSFSWITPDYYWGRPSCTYTYSALYTCHTYWYHNTCSILPPHFLSPLTPTSLVSPSSTSNISSSPPEYLSYNPPSPTKRNFSPLMMILLSNTNYLSDSFLLHSSLSMMWNTPYNFFKSLPTSSIVLRGLPFQYLYF